MIIRIDILILSLSVLMITLICACSILFTDGNKYLPCGIILGALSIAILTVMCGKAE
jgi:hypothetical protein